MFLRRLKSLQCLLLPLSLFLAAFACAQESSPDGSGQVSERDYLQEFPVVLSASRLSQPQSEAPSAMTVIDRQMIADSGFRNIADLFRLVPGMYIGYIDGYSPSVSYHGLTDMYSRRMQVMIDGRTTYMPPFNGVDWVDLPILVSDIERIEVIRGPAASSYGANSLQGVINIITRDPATTHGKQVTVSKGNAGVSDVAVHLGTGDEEWDYKTTLGYRADDGFSASALNDSSQSRLINTRVDHRLSTSDSVGVQFGYTESVLGKGIDINNPQEPLRNANTYSGFVQAAWSHIDTQGDETKLSYYYVYHNTVDGIPFFGSFVKMNSLANRHDIELQQILQMGAVNRLVWGAGLRQDAAEVDLILAPKQQIRQSRLFAHDEWRATNAAVINLGGMYEDDGMGHKNVSPRLALNYHLQPQQTLRTGVSVAYRNPAMIEARANAITLIPVIGVYQPFIGSQNLQPEKNLSREIGYLGEFAELSTSVDARIYLDEISDMIWVQGNVPFATPTTQGFANLMSVSHKGFESTVKYQWGARGDIVLNYAHQLVSCQAAGSTTDPTKVQNAVNGCSMMLPLNSGSLLLGRQVTDDVRFSLGYYVQGPVQVLDAIETQLTMRRVDLKLSKSIGRREAPVSGEVALVVQNAFQDNYADYTNSNSKIGMLYFDRRAYVVMSLNL